MARLATNQVVAALRERHRTELAAAGAVTTAADRLAAAAVVHDVAVAVLASVLGGDQPAAAVLGSDVAAVRTARERAPAPDVRAELDRLRGRGGRRGARAPAGRVGVVTGQGADVG